MRNLNYIIFVVGDCKFYQQTPLELFPQNVIVILYSLYSVVYDLFVTCRVLVDNNLSLLTQDVIWTSVF